MNTQQLYILAQKAGYEHPQKIGSIEDFQHFNIEYFAELVAAAERERSKQILREISNTFGKAGVLIWTVFKYKVEQP